MSDGNDGGAPPTPVGLAAVVAGRPLSLERPFWTRLSGAPADLVDQLEIAVGQKLVLADAALMEWLEDLHRAYCMLVAQRPSQRGSIRASEGERLQDAIDQSDELMQGLLGLISSGEAEVSRTAYEAARALLVFRQAAQEARTALSRPGAKTKAPRLRAIRELLDLYQRGFGSAPGRSRGGPATRFIATMFDAAGSPHLSDSTIYNLMVQTTALTAVKD